MMLCALSLPAHVQAWHTHTLGPVSYMDIVKADRALNDIACEPLEPKNSGISQLHGVILMDRLCVCELCTWAPLMAKQTCFTDLTGYESKQ